MKPIEPAKLAEFLGKPRTATEIAAHFGIAPDEIGGIRGMQLPKNQAVFEQKNGLAKSVFVCSEQPHAPPLLKPRSWRLMRQPKGQPYLWIQFIEPKHRRLKIVGLSDIHYGAKAHSRQRFAKYLEWILAQDDVYVFLNGDIIENAIDGSIGGSVYESILTPDEQIWGTEDGREAGMIELLRPIAHKILWAQPGNHEWRTWKKTNVCPLKIICRQLDIPYYNEPIYADVLAWGHRFTFYCHHGTTGSGTKGGKLNAAGRPAEFQEAVDFIIMGHVHDSMDNATTRIVRRREFDENNKLIDFGVEERDQHVVICPSFYGYFGSYGSRAGYAPGSWGSIACTLYHDGNYRVSE